MHDIAKKYVCRLDECGKRFTLLGNLKRHINRFHAKALGALAARFAESEAREGGKGVLEDEMLEYFRGLYSKGRKVASTSHNTDNTATSPPSLSSSTSLLASPSLTSVSYTSGVPAHFNINMDGM